MLSFESYWYNSNFNFPFCETFWNSSKFPSSLRHSDIAQNLYFLQNTYLLSRFNLLPFHILRVIPILLDQFPIFVKIFRCYPQCCWDFLIFLKLLLYFKTLRCGLSGYFPSIVSWTRYKIFGSWRLCSARRAKLWVFWYLNYLSPWRFEDCYFKSSG